MAEEEKKYNLSYTRYEVDEAVGRVKNPDTTPTSGHTTKLVTSHGVAAKISELSDSVNTQVTQIGSKLDNLESKVAFIGDDNALVGSVVRTDSSGVRKEEKFDIVAGTEYTITSSNNSSDTAYFKFYDANDTQIGSNYSVTPGNNSTQVAPDNAVSLGIFSYRAINVDITMPGKIRLLKEEIDQEVSQLGQKVGEQASTILDVDVDATQGGFTYISADLVAEVEYKVKVNVTSSLKQTLSLWENGVRVPIYVNGTLQDTISINTNSESIGYFTPSSDANQIGLWTNAKANSEHIEISHSGYGLTATKADKQETQAKFDNINEQIDDINEQIFGSQVDLVGANDSIKAQGIETEIGKTYLVLLTPWDTTGVTDGRIIFVVQDSNFLNSQAAILKGENIPSIISFIATTSTSNIVIRATSGENVRLYYGDSKTIEIAIQSLYDKTKGIDENALKVAYLDWSHSYYEKVFGDFATEKFSVLGKSQVIANRHKTPVFEADFSSQQSFEDDFVAAPNVDQTAYPHVISRPKENLEINDGALYVKNILDAEETQTKGTLRFTCGNAVFRDDTQEHIAILNEVANGGMIEADFCICQATGVNCSFWGNGKVDRVKGDAYFSSKYPSAAPPVADYTYELDVNEGKYPNKIDMTTHLWHGISADGTIPAGNIASGGSLGLHSGNLLNRLQYNVHLNTPTTIKVLKLAIQKFSSATMHIAKLFFYGNGVPCAYPNLLSSTRMLEAFAVSLNKDDIVESITYDAGGLDGYGAEHICDNTTGTDKHYVTNSMEEKTITVTFRTPQNISDILLGTGWGGTNPTDGSIRLSYKENAEQQDYVELYDNGVNVKVMSDIYNYKCVWDSNKIYWLLNDMIIREADNNYINHFPAIKFSTMVADWAGDVTSAIDGTYLKVIKAGIYK